MPQLFAMFPGQGSQYVGMGKELCGLFPKAMLKLEECEDISKTLVKKLCFEGPDNELKLTKNQQLCILAISIAIWEVLQEETNIPTPACFAGHSLGEYSALVAAQKLNYKDAITLVRDRGIAMQEAVPLGQGTMVAALGRDILEKVELACSQTNKEFQNHQISIEIANYNSPGQLILSGHSKAIEFASLKLKEMSIRVMPIAVNSPFHSKMMAPARKKMTPLLLDTQLRENKQRVFANVLGKIPEKYNTELLIRQIDEPVYWMQTIHETMDQKIDYFLEIGPSQVLSNLAKRTIDKKYHNGNYQVVASDSIKEAIANINKSFS